MKKNFTQTIKSYKLLFMAAMVAFGCFPAMAQLSGTYTIDATKSASATNYVSFNDAVADLLTATRTSGTANGPGVKGAVVFKVANGTYDEAIQIDTITGATAAHNVTFESASGDSSKVILKDTAGGYTVYLNGADFITFKKMTIWHDVANGHVIQIDGYADSNRFLNNRLIGMKVSGYSYPYPCVVYSGTYPYTDDSSNWFINNTMENGFYSVYMLGDYNTSGELGNRFVGNQVSGAFYGGFMLIYQDHITVTHNKININSSSAYYGVYIYSYKASSGDSSLVANNMISVIGNQYSYGLMAYYLNLGNIYNNSVYTQSSSGYSAYLYNNSTLNVINNNFVNMGGGYAISAYNPSWTDYNNFYVTGSNLGQFNYSTVADLAAWQSASSQDANSYSVDPLYKSKVNLHTGNVKLNNTGNSVPSVKDDFDGELRGAKPDIGADEFTPKADDAGVVSIDSPGNGSCGGSINTYVTVFNFGTSVLKKFDINWTINGVAQTAYSYSSATGVSIGGKQQFNLGAHTFATGSTFNIVSFTSKPNGVADSVSTNDTTKTIFATNGMKGTFTIGSTGNYTTFTAAVADLVSKGVCAATTFNVDDATYSETVSIPSIPGAGPVNTITFKAAKGDSTKVILDWPVSSTYGDYALQFNNASYIYFDKMTITRSGSGNYGNVIDVRSGTHNVTVSNSIIHSVNGTYSFVIYSGQDDDSFNTFRNNAIYNGYYGVYFYGGREKGNVFEYNTIDSVQYYGILLYYNFNFNVSNNLIKGIQTQYGAGLYSYSYNIYGSSKINNNKIILDNGGYGLFCYYLLGTTGDSAYITNNFVSVAAGTNGYGLYFIYSDYANFYHNNVNIHNSNSSSYAAYFANYSSVTSNRVYNNNLVNIAGGYALVSTNSTITDEDYNNYYVGSTSAYLAMWNGTSCTTLSDLQTNNSMDANSMSIDPKYRDKRNLHILNVALNGKAMPIGVSKDIDGQTRNGSKPDVGADEIFPVANDAGVLTIDSPLLGFCAGTRDVYARVFNFGTANLTSCTVNWTINGTTQTPVTFSGSLTVGGSALVKLGSNAFSAATKYSIVSYTTSPNGVADVVHDNDTASSLIQTGLSGTLTIGSSGTYTTFTAAATDLNTRGVCAATTIVVDDGFYPEQIVLDHVPGTTSIKTVTFTSKSGDSSKVVLDYPSGGTSANYVVYLKGSSYIKFEKMTISRSVGSTNSYGNVVVVDGGSSFNTFTNDVLQSVPVSGYAYMSYVVYSAGDNDSFNTFNNSIIRHGTYGFYWFGPSSSQMEVGTLIQGNLMDSSAYGNYLWYQSNIRLKNNVLRDYNYYALMAYYWSNGCQITGNKISADKYFGLYLYNAQGYSDTIFIANNMITTNLQYTFYGVAQIYYSDNVAFVFNSVQCTNAGNVTYFYNGSTPASIIVYNNILYNAGGGYAHYTNNGFTKSDYNDIYSTGNFASYNGSAISDLATWKSTTGTDKNSMSVDPSFFAVDDLHTKKGNFNGRAKVIGRIHKDIDNDPRDPSTPDIGADEFTPPANDVGVDSIITPYGTTCGDSHTVITVQVGNFGSASQSNIPVYVIVNGGTPISGTLVGPLAAGKDSSYSFKTTINTFAGGTFTIKAYTALKGDVDSTNDTIRTTVTFNIPSTVLSSKGVTSCTPGSYKLAAKVSSTKDTIYWYSAATGGKLLATGDTFKTPFISVPTTYYAQADAVRKTAGLANTAAGGATVNHSTFTRGLYFDAINDFILDTITVFPDKSGTLVVNVYDNGGTLIYTKSVPVKPTKAYGPAKAGLGFAITAGTGYWIEATGSSGFGYLKGNTTASKIKYPMYGGNLVSITGSYNPITGSDYYFFYNWQVSNYAGCPSNRVAVTANIGGTKAGFGYISSCATNTVAFTDSSVYSVGKFASRKWDFGDTKTDTAKNPVHKYASSATYKVKLTITSSTGCTDTAVKYISFGTAPKASFTFTDVCIGSANSYTDNTSFGGKYTRLWRFGDGGFDTAKSTTHTYTKAGSYNVTLVTVAAGGCADSINKTVSVFDNPVVKFGASSSCLSNPVMFTDSTTLNGTSGTYSWSFGDATTDTLQNPSHKYSSTGIKTVTLSVTSNHGCSAAKSKVITVDADPDAKFSSTVISPTSYSFAPSNTTYSGYSWNFGDGNTSTTQSPTHSYTANGSYKVKLTVDNGKGCKAVDSTTVTITGIVSVGVGNNLSIFPNPFKEATNINYTLANANKVNITVYDVVGRKIATLMDAQLTAGNYNTTFTPADWNSNKAGVYLIRITIGDAVVNKEVILVK